MLFRLSKTLPYGSSFEKLAHDTAKLEKVNGEKIVGGYLKTMLRRLSIIRESSDESLLYCTFRHDQVTRTLHRNWLTSCYRLAYESTFESAMTALFGEE
jgi:hypothetical protein